jgi:hypothetical protein
MINHFVRACLGLLAVLLLAACGVPVEEQDEQQLGGATPEDSIATFVADLNAALSDPELTEREVRQRWARRLASSFAPVERVDQRYVMQQMLADYASRRADLGNNLEVSLEISYEGLQVLNRQSDYPTVRLVNGAMRLREVRVAENGYRNIVNDQQYPLTELLGQGPQDGFPVVRVSGRWFLTER